MILTLDQKLPEAKVIIHKSRVEVLEQDTIECVSILYLRFVLQFQFMFFFTFISCNFLVQTLQYLKRIEKRFAFKKFKKCPQKYLIYNRLGWELSVLPTSPNLKFCSIKNAHRATYL